MSLDARHRARVAAFLATGITETEALIDCLEQEFEALSSGEPERIRECAERKRTQLQRLEERLGEMFRPAGPAPTPPGDEIGRLLEALPEDDPLARQWQQLRETSLRLREQNDINGNVIRLSQQHVHQSLDILIGATAGGDTYGPEGDRFRGRRMRTLARV